MGNATEGWMDSDLFTSTKGPFLGAEESFVLTGFLITAHMKQSPKVWMVLASSPRPSCAFGRRFDLLQHLFG